MLDHLITLNTGVSVLPSGLDLSGCQVKQQWECALDLVLSRGDHCILDCGALLAGVSNESAAQYLISRLSHWKAKADDSKWKPEAVCYYDSSSRKWMILETSGRRLPRGSSPVQENRAITIYDDARCRGADLQLMPNAIGLLTLSSTICKDKLMQAAGRLRMFGRGQRVHVACMGPDDWNAPSTWSKGGDRREHRLMPLDLEVEVQSRTTDLGKRHLIISSRGADEECERELEREEEEEKEQEKEVPKMNPADETDWDYMSILDAQSANSLHGAGVTELETALLNGLGLDINWSGCELVCTKNFAATIQGSGPVKSSDGDSNPYLRPVRSLLLFPASGQVLLLTEREADSALEYVYRLKHSGSKTSVISSPPLLLNLGYTAEAASSGLKAVKLAVGMSKGGRFLLDPSLHKTLPMLSVQALARLLLFDGECVYESEALKQALHGLVRRKKGEVEKIVAMRGRDGGR